MELLQKPVSGVEKLLGRHAVTLRHFQLDRPVRNVGINRRRIVRPLQRLMFLEDSRQHHSLLVQIRIPSDQLQIRARKLKIPRDKLGVPDVLIRRVPLIPDRQLGCHGDGRDGGN